MLACSLEDGLYGHEYFVSAAYGLVTAYLAIFDKPKQSAAAAQAEAEAALSDSERKKLENKRKKAALKVAHPPALAPRPLRCLRLASMLVPNLASPPRQGTAAPNRMAAAGGCAAGQPSQPLESCHWHGSPAELRRVAMGGIVQAEAEEKPRKEEERKKQALPSSVDPGVETSMCNLSLQLEKTGFG